MAHGVSLLHPERPVTSFSIGVGVKTDHLGADPTETQQTFYGSTRTAMETQLAQITTAYAGSTAYGGSALHAAAGYVAMAP